MLIDGDLSARLYFAAGNTTQHNRGEMSGSGIRGEGEREGLLPSGEGCRLVGGAEDALEHRRRIAEGMAEEARSVLTELREEAAQDTFQEWSCAFPSLLFLLTL